MPLRQRRKTYRKKSTRKSMRKMTRSRSFVPRNRFDSQIYYFKRWVAGPTIQGNAAWIPYLGGGTWSLSQLPGVTDFTTLFDQYAITKIVSKWYLKIDPSAQAAGTASFPRIYIANDRDTGTGATSLDEIRQYGGCKVKVMNPNYPVTHSIRPNTLRLQYLTGVSNTFTPDYGAWVDMTNTNCPYYGLIWAIDDLTNTNYRVTQEFIFYFKCKNTR